MNIVFNKSGFQCASVRTSTTDLDLHPREEKVVFHPSVEAQPGSVDEGVCERHDIDGHDEGVRAPHDFQRRL